MAEADFRAEDRAGARGRIRAGAVARPAGRFAIVELGGAMAIAAEWRALRDRAAEDNPFFDPGFALPAARTIGRGVGIATWRREDGSLAALAPVTASRLGRLAPARRIWSHEYGPLGVPLVERIAVDRAVAGLLGGLMEGGASLVLPDLPADGPVAAAVTRFAAAAGRPLVLVNGHRRAMLRRPDSGTVDCRAGLPARRRKEYGRQMRRLADLGPVSVESTRDREAVRARFESFLALEAAGWKGRRGTALAADPAVASMAREIVAMRSAEGTVEIGSLNVGSRPVAMLVSLLAGTTAYSWKIAFDEAYARFSPGAQLMLEAGRTLLSIPGIRQVDSCATAHHPMIDPLWPDRLAIGTIVLGPAGGSLIHDAGLAALRAETRARGLARSVLRRRRRTVLPSV